MSEWKVVRNFFHVQFQQQKVGAEMTFTTARKLDPHLLPFQRGTFQRADPWLTTVLKLENANVTHSCKFCKCTKSAIWERLWVFVAVLVPTLKLTSFIYRTSGSTTYMILLNPVNEDTSVDLDSVGSDQALNLLPKEWLSLVMGYPLLLACQNVKCHARKKIIKTKENKWPDFLYPLAMKYIQIIACASITNDIIIKTLWRVGSITHS